MFALPKCLICTNILDRLDSLNVSGDTPEAICCQLGSSADENTTPLKHKEKENFPAYQPFLLAPDIDQLTICGGFAGCMLGRLTTHSDCAPLLPRPRLLTITDRSPLTDEEMFSCLQSRKDFHFAVRLVDEELPCEVYRDLGFTVKCRFRKHFLFCLTPS